MTRQPGFNGWLFEGRSTDPTDRAIEPLVRVAMLIGVASSVMGVWIGWVLAADRATYLGYALRATPLQITGLLCSLAVLQRHGPVASARVFGAFVTVAIALTAVGPGPEVIAAALVRLAVPTIILSLALVGGESALWVLALLAAAWLGVVLEPFHELPEQARRRVVGALATASLVLGTCQMIFAVLRRALQREIAAAAASAVELARSQRIDSLGRLAAGTAHDFNGLLGAILLTAEEMEDAPSAGERARAAASIKVLVRQSADLTRRLLQFARGDGESEDGRIDVRKVVEEALAAVRPTYGKRITVTRTGTEVAATVQGSGVELRQVVTNLLMNAGDAIQGAGTVHLSVELTGSGRDRRVRVLVRDSGPGVDPSVRATLFEPFVSTKLDGKGTGLGLPTAQAIVERHGGQLVLDADAPTPGATFVLTLPVALTT